MNKKENKMRQYRSNQGRSPRQQETNEKIMFIGCVGLFVVLFGIVLYGIFSQMARLNKPDTIVVVHKGPRKNSKIKLEIFNNGTRVDDIINMRKLKPIIPKENDILDIGVGESFIERYKKKYKF